MYARTNPELSAPTLTPEQAAWVADYEAAELPFNLPVSRWYTADKARLSGGRPALCAGRPLHFLDQRYSAAVTAPPAREPAADAALAPAPAQPGPMKKAHG